MSNPLISADNITKTYRIYEKPSDRLKEIFVPWRCGHTEFAAIKSVSFSVMRGDSLGIIGTNGAGKSTLLQIISGVLTPTSGTIQTQGRIAALLELGAGFNPEATGIENIVFLASMQGISNSKISQYVNDVIAFSDIGDFIQQPVKIYSSGMFVRLAFAANIVCDPDVLIVDEALSVGDIYFQQKCLRRMEDFLKNGTLIFVSHDMASIKKLCNKAIWLESGQIKKIGSADEVCDHYLEAFHQSAGQRFCRSLQDQTNVSEDRNCENTASCEKTTAEAMISAHGHQFNNKEQFGSMSAEIQGAAIVDHNNKHVYEFHGGETCRLLIKFYTKDDFPHCNVGFAVKDRLGQFIFGTNTHDELSTIDAHPQQTNIIEFKFVMPTLIAGNYTITLSLFEGDCNNYVQLHWIHDALTFQVVRDWDRGVMMYLKMDSVRQIL